MDNKFTYEYKASKNAEVEKIKSKYLPPAAVDERLEQLKKLDKSCERPGQIAAIIVGILGTAVFSFGMVALFGHQKYMSGVLISMLGLIIMAMAVPVFYAITKKQRKRIAPKILKISEEIEKNPSP